MNKIEKYKEDILTLKYRNELRGNIHRDLTRVLSNKELEENKTIQNINLIFKKEKESME